MRLWIWLSIVSVWPALGTPAGDEPPREWIDPDTGHRVVRLSREPGSSSLYFHQNAFTARGDKMVLTTPGGISTVNLKTHAIELVVPGTFSGPSRITGIVVGRKSRQVYYARREGATLAAFATQLDTRITRRIGNLPAGGSLMTINADESLLAGSLMEREAPAAPSPAAPTEAGIQSGPGPGDLARQPGENKGAWMLRRFQSRAPMQLFTLDIPSGKVRSFHPSTDWLNHVQMSPTDPSLLMFCHEGPWHLVDRIWIVRTEGQGLKAIHPRAMEMEIAGHEFFSADGQWIWYDLQTPRGEDFWLAGYEIATGARARYHLQRDEWSVHYNISPDGSLFAGDGGDSGMVAHARNGKWIYLFRPQPVSTPRGPPPAGSSALIKPGVLRAERLVNMAKHNYHLEPNVNFTPDGKWIVFRSNMHGPTHVYAVEVEKTSPPPPARP